MIKTFNGTCNQELVCRALILKISVMNEIPKPYFAVIICAALFFGLVASTSGEVLGITDMTFSPDPGDALNDGTINISSFSTSTGTYSGLQGPTTSTISGTSYYGWDPSTGDTGASEGTDSLLGLNVSTGLFGSGTITAVNFGQVVDTDAVFFLTEFLASGANDDTITLVALDIKGEVIGDYSLSILEMDWGEAVLSQNIAGAGNFSGYIRGVSFLLSDFVGTTGDLSTIAGLSIISNSGADISVIGFATVPEPASVALLLAGFALLATGMRRRFN
jgi:hypothetical protein